MTIAGKKKSPRIEKMLQRMAVLQLILYISIKGGLHEICWWLIKGLGKSKAGKSLL